MYRKKVLFIVGSLKFDGLGKSIIRLLNAFDTDRYEVSVLLLSQRNSVLYGSLPTSVNVICDSDIDDLHSTIIGFTSLIARGRYVLAIGSLLRMTLSCFSKSKAGLLLAKLMPAIDGHYDLIVDYGGQQLLYYMVNKLKGDKKISFFHSDYRKWNYYYNADKNYYPKVDAIFTVSKECVVALREVFPECKEKIRLMYNIVSPEMVWKMARLVPVTDGDELKIVTVGHISESKGTDLAIEAARMLKLRGMNFKWTFVGEVRDNRFRHRVDKLRLDEDIVFAGSVMNPYAIMNSATIIVHPARFEGKSVALDEAKILCKPIVVTNYSTVNDQFENRKNATICEMNAEAIFYAIMELFENKQLRDYYVANLKDEIHDNSSEVNKLYAFLEKTI